MSKEKEKKTKAQPEETAEKQEEIKEAEAAEKSAEEKLGDELNQTKDKLLRVMAEYDNFRKRSQKEKETAFGDSKASTITEFLPLFDNLGRAVAADDSDMETYKKGMEMIFNQFGEILKKLGVESFGEKGDTFDPNIHNAVMHEEDEEQDENIVTEVFSPGYKLGDRIIRPAIVKVVN